MYKSPITIFQDITTGQINIDMENNIVKAVMHYNIDVDEEELLKALKYDREQYQKGYEDGKREFAEMLVERLEEERDVFKGGSLKEYYYQQAMGIAIDIAKRSE